jgi:hypothetical protein
VLADPHGTGCDGILTVGLLRSLLR